MANLKISELPLFTGNTSGSYLVMNNSGQTQTFKVLRESVIGASGTSGTSGSSGSSGAAGSSGSSGTSGIGVSGSSGTSGSSGDSIFAQTGSYWNTTRNVGITGSVNINTGASEMNVIGTATFANGGNSSISFVSGAIFEGGTTDLRIGLLGNGKNLILNTDIFGTTQTGSIILKNNTSITGSLSISGNTTITGSLNVSGAAFSDVNINGRMTINTISGSATLGGNFTPNLNIISGSINSFIGTGRMQLDNGADRIELTSDALTGNKTQIRTVDPSTNTQTIIELPCSSSWNGGATKFKYPVEVTGSVKLTEALNIKPLYFGTGSVYNNDLQAVPGTPGDIRIVTTDGGLYNLVYFTVSGSNSWAIL